MTGRAINELREITTSPMFIFHNNHVVNAYIVSYYSIAVMILGLWLRLECSLDSLSIDSAHVIYVSEGYDVAYNRRTASQPSYVVLRVTWYVKTFRNVNYVR